MEIKHSGLTPMFCVIVLFFCVLPTGLYVVSGVLFCPKECNCIRSSANLTITCRDPWHTDAIVIPEGVEAVEMYFTEKIIMRNIDHLFSDHSWNFVKSFGLFHSDINPTLETFRNLINVTHITVSGIQPVKWDLECFQHANKLESLNLSDSFDLMFDDVAVIINSTMHTPLKHLNLSRTNQWLNVGTQQPISDLLVRTFMKTKIEVIDISYTGTLIYSKDDMFKYYEEGLRPQMLKEIYAEGVTVSHYGKHVRSYGQNMNLLSFMLASARKVIISGTNVPDYYIDDRFDNCGETEPLCNEHDILFPPNLTEVRFEDSNVIGRCYTKYGCPRINPNNSLATLSVQRIHIKTIHLELAQLCLNLRVIDATGNNINYAIPTLFKGLLGLKIVKLGNNIIGSNSDFPLGEIFSFSGSLEIVDLSYNQLTDLPVNMFVNNHEIRLINLSYNGLVLLRLDIKHLVKLRTLDLTGNKIRLIEHHTFQQVNNILSFGKQEFVDLSENDIVCSCDHVAFVKQLRDIRDALMAFETYQCIISDSKKEFLVSVEENHLDLMCYILLLKIGIPCFGFVMLCLTCVAIGYRNRLFFLKIYIHFRFWRHIEKRFDTEERVFVAYCAKDKIFALNLFNKINPILQKLMGTQNDVLYINDKHFELGGVIDDEIVKAVRSCRCTLAIISEHFANSTWVKLETSLTWAEKKPLIPVFVHKMKRRDLTRVLRYYYDTKVRLLYPTEDGAEDLFWHSLLVGIADVLNKRKELLCLIADEGLANDESMDTPAAAADIDINLVEEPGIPVDDATEINKVVENPNVDMRYVEQQEARAIAIADVYIHVAEKQDNTTTVTSEVNVDLAEKHNDRPANAEDRMHLVAFQDNPTAATTDVDMGLVEKGNSQGTVNPDIDINLAENRATMFAVYQDVDTYLTETMV